LAVSGAAHRLLSRKADAKPKQGSDCVLASQCREQVMASGLLMRKAALKDR